MTNLTDPAYRDDCADLVRVLAVAIASRLRELLCRESSVGDNELYYVHHMYQSDFEIACDVLWRLGISYGSFSEGRGPTKISRDEYYQSRKPLERLMFPPFFSIPSTTEASAGFRQNRTEDMPRVEVVIDAYLRIATDYGQDHSAHLPTARGVPFFATHPDQLAVLEEFNVCGYARKSGKMYIWTDQMLPMMAHAWLWTEDDIDLSAVDHAKMLDEAVSILKCLDLPNSESERKKLRGLSIAFRALEIQYRWDGHAWRKQLAGSPRLTFDEALAVSSLLEDDLQP